MGYENFYNLKFEPFANLPDPKFYFNSPQHAIAREYLMHAARGTRGLAVLLGEIGTGKTTLVRKILTELHASGKFQVGLLVLTHSSFPAGWLLTRIGNLIGLRDFSSSATEIISRISDRLMEIYHRGEKTVIIIDEANKINGPDILEELRGLLNLEIAETRLVTFIMSGLPDLETMLLQNKPLYQRIAIKVKLRPMGAETVKGYINHRLKIAGCDRNIFTARAINLLARFSDGRPRLVNVLCDNALLEGYVQRKAEVDDVLIERVVVNLGLKVE